MADEDLAAALGDVKGESSDDKHPADIDVPSFGVGTEVQDLAAIDPEFDDKDHRVVDEPLLSADSAADPGGGPQPIGGYRAEWRPSGGESDGASDTFDATDLRAGTDTSFGAGATDAQLHIADDVKYSDDADPWGDGPHEVDIGGSLDEPTDIPIGPAEVGDPVEPDLGAVTEVSDTDAPLAATDSTKFEDVD